MGSSVDWMSNLFISCFTLLYFPTSTLSTVTLLIVGWHFCVMIWFLFVMRVFDLWRLFFCMSETWEVFYFSGFGWSYLLIFIRFSFLPLMSWLTFYWINIFFWFMISCDAVLLFWLSTRYSPVFYLELCFWFLILIFVLFIFGCS